MLYQRFLKIALLLTLLTSSMSAQDEISTSTTSQPEIVVKEKTLELPQKILSYNTLTGTLPLTYDTSKEKARIFFTAYFLKDAEIARPITFCFNGGPGSSAIWLHLGGLGPKKVIIDDIESNQSPGKIEDNIYTLLKVSDLVFVDPVSTGYSRAADGVDAKHFYGVQEDINSMAEFIRLFVTRYHRWQSPIFLLGESYATLRVVGIAEKLKEDYFLNVNGIILISSFLDVQTHDLEMRNDLTYILNLPTYAASAWYHHKLPEKYQKKTLTDLLALVENFSIHDYASALLAGDNLDEGTKKKIAQQVSDFTGLPISYVLRSNLRIKNMQFLKELLRDNGKILSRFDTRRVGLDSDDNESTPSYDPTLDGIGGSFTSAFQHYINDELGWKNDSTYHTLNLTVHPWNWNLKNNEQGFPSYLSLLETLRSLMIRDPKLRLFVASGNFDIATPYFATKYSMSHLQLPPSIRKNVEQHTYPAGHMMYLNDKILIQMNDDISKFIQKSD